ncbi:GEVED domain-containing protein [Chryseobacterium sp. KACC 21268]|nr:GEVED domain-containing protein [Chryseobacterium sp. KACC 21268]
MKKYLFFKRMFEGNSTPKTFLFSFFFLIVTHFSGQVTMFQFDFESGTSPSVDNVTGTPSLSNIGILSNYNTTACNGVGGYQYTAWDSGDAYRFTVNTTGFTNMTFNYNERTSNNSIGNFLVRVSSDGANWTTIRNAYVPTSNCEASGSLTIPNTFGNQALMYVEIYKPSNAGAAGNNFRIDDATLIGYVLAPCSGTPTPGNTLAATNPVVSGGTTVLSLQNSTAGSGVTYQWQSSTTSASSGFSNVTGATNSTYTATVTAKTWYRCLVTCGSNNGTSNPVEVNLTYCTPAGSLNCTLNDFISNITINTLNNSTACNSGGYTLFPASGTQTTSLTQGSAYVLSLSVGSGTGTHSAAVYIDWNQDGDFVDASEFILIGNSIAASSTNTVSVNVPSGAVFGNTRMRVRYSFNQNMTIATSCTIAGNYGETEDYIVNVVAPPANPVLAISGTPIDHGSACLGTAATPVTYTITNTGASAATGVSLNSSDPQFAVSGLSSSTIAGSGGTATFTVTFTPSSAGAKSATITVSSLTSGSNAPTITLGGTGNASVTPVAVALAANNITVDAARLRASAGTTFGVCPTTVEKGFVYSSVNSLPTVTDTKIAIQPLGTTGVAYNYDATGLFPATTYYYRAYLYDGTTYTYSAVRNFTTLTPPANDLCGNAVDVTVNSAAITGTLVNSTFSAPFSSGRDVWYKFTPGCSGNHTVTVNGFSGDVDIYLYQGCPTVDSALAASSSNTGTSEAFTYNVTAGVTYYVAVSAYDAAAESSVFNISVNNQIPIVTQPLNQVVTEGTTASFGISTPGNQTGRQWQVSTDNGVSWNNIAGATGSPYVTPATTIAMNGYKYRAVISNGTCSTVISNEVTLTVNYASPNNAANLAACIANNQITLKWAAPATGSAPTGYIVFALPNTTVPAMTAASAGNASSYIANSDYSVANTYTTLGKAVYKGSALTATVTGLVNASQYTFKVVAYRGETGTAWAGGINATGSWNQTYLADVPEISNLAASINPTSSTVTWNVVPASVGCYEYLVVANQGAVSFTPSGDGSAYTSISSVYTMPNQVVYKGTGNSVIVTGLTDGLQYCYKVFVREINSGNQWSDGTSVCQTTGVNYCTSTGSMTDLTSITYVKFNTIENATPTKVQAYTNFATPTTTVVRGEVIPLTVRVNTDGDYTVYTKVWFDWNRDGDFADSGEEFVLGTAKNVTDGATSLSPLNITIPTTAALGNVRMRVSSKFNLASTSCESFTFGEVEDYTITVTQPTNAEINVKGGNISIPNGFDEPYGLNNTVFAATNIGSESTEKEFTIENLGLANLNLTGSPIINIIGTNPSDFIVTQQAVTPVVNGVTTSFKIKFRPTVAGIRQADVSIANNDSDENPYVFRIQGTGTCATSLSIAASPLSGPANTIVTFTSSVNDLSSATVTYNDVAVPIISANTGKLEVAVPAGALDANFVVSLLNGCNATQVFDVINSVLTDCETTSGGPVTAPASDLIIYEVYDEKSGSGGIVTIFNRTGSAVNLSSYSIQRAGDYGGTYSTYANLSGTVAAGSIAIVGVSGSSCGYVTTGNGGFGTGFNANDGIRLMKGTVVIDDVHAPNITGFYLRRKNDYLSPKTVFDGNEWTNQALASGQCLPSNEVGQPPVVKNPPIVNTQPSYSLSCDVEGTSLAISASEGVVGGNGLTYQWFVLGTSGTWNALANGGVYSGATSATLNISNVTGLNNYQYYCQVRENTATCFTATNAVQIKDVTNTWEVANVWSNGTPILASKVIIAGNYDTQVHGALDVCELTVNSSGTMVVKPSSPIKVKKKITNLNTANDSFVVESDANMIQVDNITNEGSIKVERSVTDMNNVTGDIDYVYWSSPVNGQTIKTGFSPGTPASGYQQYNESNDRFIVTQDVNFVAGKGYAIRAETGFPDGYSKTYSFTGIPHNGNLSSPFLNKSAGADKGYNLIGNPYPSNIDFDLLHSLNSAKMFSTAFFWTNNTYERLQMGSAYAGNNYAIYNGTGGAPGTYNDENPNYGIAPNGIVKVGQGFIIQSKIAGAIDFNNSIRLTDNGTFYQRGIVKNRFWLTLKSPNNLINTILIGYIPGATDNFETDFDGELFAVGSDSFYSILGAKKLAIQGKADNFSVEDVVPVGNAFSVNGDYTIRLKTAEGIFNGSQKIYLKDKLLNKYIDLSSETSYTFSAVKGADATRFEIVFKENAVLGNDETQKSDFIVYKDGDHFVIKSSKVIGKVDVYDAGGRLIRQLFSKENKLIIDAVDFANGVYIIKAQNSGDVKTKKILK